MFTKEEIAEIQAVKERALKLIDSKLYFTPPHADEELRRLVGRGILTGGVFASLFHNQLPHDFDIYFKDDRDIVAANKYFLDEKNIPLIKDINPAYIHTVVDGKCFTANAVTLDNDLQFIMLGNSNMRKFFDFVHCMPYLDLDSKKFYISGDQYRAIKTRYLVKNPAGHTPTRKRIEKYMDRGYRFSPEIDALYMTYINNSQATSQAVAF